MFLSGCSVLSYCSCMLTTCLTKIAVTLIFVDNNVCLIADVWMDDDGLHVCSHEKTCEHSCCAQLW